MTTFEKHLLILDPLLEELAPLGYFRKGKQLWHINPREGYAILIEAEMYIRGTCKRILVQYGSFWKEVTASRQGVSLGSMYTIDDRCIPFDTFGFDTAEELDRLVRDGAACLAAEAKRQIIPILCSIHDLASFVKASEALDALNSMISWPRGERVWDYFALGDKNRAFAYLQHQIDFSWRAVFETAIDHLPLNQQEEQRRSHAIYDSQLDRIARQNREQLQHFMNKLAQLSDTELAQIMQERFNHSQAALSAFIGLRRWNQL